MNIATYLRVSTDDQTLEPQRIELGEYCARQGWSVVGEWSDVISGGRASRPGLDALVEKCALGGIEAVVVVKLDRLGRSVLNVVGLVGRLQKMGVAVVCSSQGIDTRDSNPCGKMILSVMAAFAEFEKDIIRERTVDGLKAARARGSVLGRRSPTLCAESERKDRVRQWAEGGRAGGVRGLGKLLGGCSSETAARMAKEYAP